MDTENRVLLVDHEKCTGCRLCELVCSVRHDNVSNPERSRIRVIKWEAEGVYVPMVCQQCEEAPCMAVCPSKALTRHAASGRVELNYNLCIGCRTCVSVCPFGAAHFIESERKVVKCDLCDGDPQCVRFCEVKAVDYVPAGRISQERKRRAAMRLRAAETRASELTR